MFQAIPDDLAAKPNTALTGVDEDQAVALYSAATVLDGIPGQYTPDDTGSTGLAAAKAMVKAGLIAGYQHTFTLVDALAALQVVPLMAGFNWYDSFDQPDAQRPGDDHARRAGPRRRMRSSRTSCCSTRSWSGSRTRGPTPGGSRAGSTCRWIDLERLLGEQGDVTVPVPLGQAPPQPAPGPEPQPVRA